MLPLPPRMDGPDLSDEEILELLLALNLERARRRKTSSENNHQEAFIANQGRRRDDLGRSSLLDFVAN
jgi:hypothetical protein